MLMLAILIDIQPFQHFRSEEILREHIVHRLMNRLGRVSLDHFLECP